MSKFCEVCNIEISYKNFSHHVKTSKHLKKMNPTNLTLKNDYKSREPEPKIEDLDESDNSSSYSEFSTFEQPDDDDDDFLNELNNNVFQTDQEKNEKFNEEERKIKLEDLKLKQQEKMLKINERIDKKTKKEKPREKTEGELEILGLDKRLLLNRINQYKTVYKDELKNVKINNSWDLEKLQKILDEIEIIVQVNSVDSFIMDTIFQTLFFAENLTAGTQNFNISGLTVKLKGNPNFMSVCKQCFIKYGTYCSSPPEAQLIVILILTAFTCMDANKRKFTLNNYLNEPIIK
jgi:hypothetical protein